MRGNRGQQPQGSGNISGRQGLGPPVHRRNHPNSAPAIDTNQPQTNWGPGTEQFRLLQNQSAFDPRHAQALHLSANAGLPSLFAPTVAGGSGFPNPSLAMGETSSQLPTQQQLGYDFQQQGLQIPQQSQVSPAQLSASQLQAAFQYMQPQSTFPTNPQAMVSALQQASAGAPQNFGLPPSMQAAAASLMSVPSIQQQQQQQHQQQALLNNPHASFGGGTTTGNFSQQLNPSSTKTSQAPALPISQPLIPPRQFGAEVAPPAMKRRREFEPPFMGSSPQPLKPEGREVNQMDKRPEEASEKELEKMTPAQRRRYERNLREQQRSFKISQQIKDLRDVLQDSNVPFKPNKYSILLSVVEYIKQLQSKISTLDGEHKNLHETISRTNEILNSRIAPSSTDGTEVNTSESDAGSDEDMNLIDCLDYRSIFHRCPAALGVAALDGRILDCNPEFQSLLDVPRDELLKQSLFNIVQNHQEIFRAMAQMLKSAEGAETEEEMGREEFKNRFWSGGFVSKGDMRLYMNLTLTMAGEGSPKFFQCALTST